VVTNPVTILTLIHYDVPWLGVTTSVQLSFRFPCTLTSIVFFFCFLLKKKT
jgi:hypothetical protein